MPWAETKEHISVRLIDVNVVRGGHLSIEIAIGKKYKLE